MFLGRHLYDQYTIWTGTICMKFPLTNNVIPPIGFPSFTISLSILSTASRAYLCLIVNTSHTMNLQFLNCSASFEYLFMLQI